MDKIIWIMRKHFYLFFIVGLCSQLTAQMNVDGEVLYGNEWIDYSKNYIKIVVEEDGIYKINYDELLAQGINPGVLGSALRLHYMGEQVPIHTSSDGSFSSDDYFLFYGEQNDGDLDKHLYNNFEIQQLNPKYSIFTDESAYFLSWGHGAQTSKRFRLTENDLSGNLPVRKDYYIHTFERVFSVAFSAPTAPEESQAHYSNFIQSEGFGTPTRRNHSVGMTLDNIISTGPEAKLKFRTGSSSSTHVVEIKFNDELLDLDSYGGNRIRNYEFQIPADELKVNSQLSVRGQAVSDNTTIAYVTVEYPRRVNAYDASEFNFTLEQNAFNTYYEVTSFPGGTENYLFDIGNEKLYIPVIENNRARIFLPQGGQERSKLVLIESSAFKSAKYFEEVSFPAFETMNPEYLVLTSELLNKVDGGSNAVEDYTAFRESDLGGGYKTGIVNVEDVIDQFGYGVKEHSYAIRNFTNYVKNKWPDFEMAFIIGKGLSYIHRVKSTPFDPIVPTYGYPGSDNLLFAEPEVTYPYVGVGRLAALTPDDIRNYQRKVEAHARLADLENGTLEDRIWLKNIIHLSGGDIGLQQLLFQHLSNMEDTIENNLFAAHVNTYRKTSTDPVQSSLSLDIIDRINEGTAILTFFGHSSANTFDFSVEDPDKYDNEGRNMVILSMGCHSGDIHEYQGDEGLSLSERMVMSEDKGAVAFVASSGNAFPSALASMGYDWYSKIGSDFYGKPLGLSLLQVLKDQYSESNAKLRTLHQQNTLHGDPATSFPAFSGPDYVVDFKTISSGEDIGSQDEKIELTFDIINLGLGRSGSLNNYVIHTYGDNVSDTTYFQSSAPFNRETINLTLNNPGTKAVGKNTINIVLDYDEKIEELPSPNAESNNDMKVAYGNEGYCFFVFDNSAFPIYPTEFAIVNDPNISLMASATNAFEDKEYFILEIDTTELFDSPLKEVTEILSSPGLIKWNPEIQFQNNQVYYWRIIPKAMTNTIWNESSFIYLENSSTGWNQSHYYQWLKDDFKNFEVDSVTRDFEYIENISEVRINNGMFPAITPKIVAENQEYQYLNILGDGEIPAGINIATFSQFSGTPMFNTDGLDGGLHGSELYTSWANEWVAFPYLTDTPEHRGRAIEFMENVIPDGDYIALWTIQRNDVGPIGEYKADEWAADAALGKDLFTVLESFGATRVRELADNPVPYVFIFKKGDTTFTPIEVLAATPTDEVDVDFKLVGRWFEGDVNSTVIGPAFKWNKLLWNIDEINLQEDQYRLDIYGLNDNGDEVLLFENVDEFDFDLSSVNSEEYPRLKLYLFSSDVESRTSAQMEYWRVLYEEKPEAVLDTDTEFVFNNDTITIGQPLTLNTIATNITNTDMDSLLVQYTIVDDQNNVVNRSERLAPLKAMETVDIDFEFDTNGLSGLHQFRVEINPGMEQPEQFQFNNIGIIDFRVEGDNINPIMDVTFDGMHIMDGDIVSSKPNICVTLKDESSFLFVEDISNFDLALQKLPSNQPFPIDLNSSDIIFIPGDTENGNVAKLQLPLDLESGEYILFVQARDASGNLSGDHEININFQVINETTVSNVLNYPNPFSTSTEFVFTLTGARVPDVFTIQIMTLSGKVVKEITKEELGNLRIGVNRSSYKWDGTDEYGSKLANGVYLYRVFTDYSGEEYEHYNNGSIDDFFKKGFGKLVILR